MNACSAWFELTHPSEDLAFLYIKASYCFIVLKSALVNLLFLPTGCCVSLSVIKSILGLKERCFGGCCDVVHMPVVD